MLRRAWAPSTAMVTIFTNSVVQPVPQLLEDPLRQTNYSKVSPLCADAPIWGSAKRIPVRCDEGLLPKRLFGFFVFLQSFVHYRTFVPTAEPSRKTAASTPGKLAAAAILSPGSATMQQCRTLYCVSFLEGMRGWLEPQRSKSYTVMLHVGIYVCIAANVM